VRYVLRDLIQIVSYYNKKYFFAFGEKNFQGRELTVHVFYGCYEFVSIVNEKIKYQLQNLLHRMLNEVIRKKLQKYKIADSA
jgi:hypothetical protein